MFRGLVLLGERRNLGLESFQVVSEPGHEGADLVSVETAEPHSEILCRVCLFVDWSGYAVGPFCSSFRDLFPHDRDLHGVIQLGALKKVELLAPNRRGRKAKSPEFLHGVPNHSR